MNFLHPTPFASVLNPAVVPAHTVAFAGFRPDKLLPTAPAHDPAVDPAIEPAHDPAHTVAFAGFRPDKLLQTAPAHDPAVVPAIEPAHDPAHTVAFAGFRPDKLLQTAPAHDLRELQALLADRLEAAIRYLYDKGFTCYLTGMAEGFDLWAAEAVVSLKSELPALKLGCILPFAGRARQRSAAYRRILTASDFRQRVFAWSHRGEFLRRNDLLLDCCSLLICYFDGRQTGGTLCTLLHARLRGRAVLNICTGQEAEPYNEGVDGELVERVRRIQW